MILQIKGKRECYGSLASNLVVLLLAPYRRRRCVWAYVLYIQCVSVAVVVVLCLEDRVSDAVVVVLEDGVGDS